MQSMCDVQPWQPRGTSLPYQETLHLRNLESTWTEMHLPNETCKSPRAGPDGSTSWIHVPEETGFSSR